MQRQRNNLIFRICQTLTQLGVHTYHSITYEGSEHVPKEGPALILAKHISLKDIFLEGVFLTDYCGRYGNWVMKSSLPRLYEYLGGIPVERSIDLRKIQDRERRKAALEQARLANQSTMDRVRQLYREKELVVAHPEGTRIPGAMGNMRKGLLDLTLTFQTEEGIRVPIVPLGIEYGSLWTPRSHVYVRAGPPLDATTPNLDGVIKREIARLSNL